MYKEGKWAKEILALQNEDGKWDMGKNARDQVYFPLADSWRKAETRISDCTWRITGFFDRLESRNIQIP